MRPMLWMMSIVMVSTVADFDTKEFWWLISALFLTFIAGMVR